MEYAFIGDVKMPVVGFGTFGMHGAVLVEAIGTALECGGAYFDTAFRYENECEVGNALRESDAVISTKLSGLQYCGKRKWLYLDGVSAKKAYRDSCRKIGRERIDLYMLHSPFRHFEKAYAELIRMRSENLVGAIGVSGFSVERLNKIKSCCGEYPQFDMIELHPYYSQKSLVDFCEEKGIKVIARSPFAHGEILRELSEDKHFSEMCSKYSKSIPQVILRWLIQKNAIAVFRSEKKEHIRDDYNVFDFRLEDVEMNYLDGLDKGRSYGVISNKIAR